MKWREKERFFTKIPRPRLNKPKKYMYEYLYDCDELPYYCNFAQDNFYEKKGINCLAPISRYIFPLLLIIAEGFEIYITNPDPLDYLFDITTWSRYSLLFSILCTKHFIKNFDVLS